MADLLQGHAIPMEPKDGHYGIFAEGVRIGSVFPLPGQTPEQIKELLKEQKSNG